jgi:hypothetical protein
MAASRSSSIELRRWVQTWREAGKALARIKRDELEQIVTATAVSQLADAFDAALKNAPSRATSGLVEQQRLFRRLHR